MSLLDSSAILAPGRVKTSSWAQMWWLTTFRRFEVERVMRFPKRYRMGRLVYGQSWVLRPPKPGN